MTEAAWLLSMRSSCDQHGRSAHGALHKLSQRHLSIFPLNRDPRHLGRTKQPKQSETIARIQLKANITPSKEGLEATPSKEGLEATGVER